MRRIDNGTTEKNDFLDALRGDYGNFEQPNGIKGRFQGGLLHFQGIFSGNIDVLEIPRVPSRLPVVFTGDDFSCCVVVEPNAGFVKVPSLARGKRFVILSTAVLNT